MPDRSTLAAAGVLRTTIVAALLLLVSTSIAIAAEPTAATLLLPSGDRVAGRLVDSPQSERLVWKAPGFLDDFEFPLKHVQAIRFETSATPTRSDAEYTFELTNGDIFLGSIASIDDQTVVIDSPGLGELQLARGALARIERRSNAELVNTGLGELDEWQVSGAKAGWTQEARHFLSNQTGAVIYRDLKIPSSARIEIDLAWTKKPRFEICLGAGNLAKAANPKFQIDVWDNDLVAVCETNLAADVAVLQQLTDEPGGVSLQIYLDQANGKMLVHSANGAPLAELSTNTSNQQVRGGLRLVNRGSDLRLEKLRIYRWNSRPPHSMKTGEAQVQRTDGTIIEGDITSYDSEGKTFLIKAKEDERTLAVDQFQGIVFGSEAPADASSVQVRMLDGTCASGELLKVADEKVFLTCRAVAQPVAFPIAGLQGFSVLQPVTTEQITLGRTGRLEAEGTSLHGSLMEIPRDGSRPAWRPLGATRGGRLAPDASVRIVYREPEPPAVPRNEAYEARVKRLAIDERVLSQLRKRKPANAARPSTGEAESECVLHLRSGDTIQCAEVTIDERGLYLKTNVSDVTFVPHAAIKVLELMPHAAAVQLDKSKKQRLLTLPRMQRGSPPTQLIRAANGDYLRGRLVAMDSKQLQVEMQLENKPLPRESVARIIWLHADEFDPQAKPASQLDPPPGIRVQAIPRDGNRLTFYADRFAAATLSGRSEILGNCHVKIGEVDELLIGSAIEKAAAQLAFHQWRLSPAIDPLEFQDNPAGEGGGEGLESALVGKPAPEISLKLLGGEEFRLSDRKDRVLVIDFWASWCGPCLQAMPQVDAVVREFAEQQVELIAINLQETPEQIKAALERLKLNMPVALDRDGRVAERYGATAIPQTVIIGRDGKVARLFVGGGARFGEQLRTALKDVLEKPVEQAAVQP